jgi:hypothetical protein
LERNAAGYEGGGKAGGKSGQGLKKVKLGRVGKVRADHPGWHTVSQFRLTGSDDLARYLNISSDRDRFRSNASWPSSKRCFLNTGSTHRSMNLTATTI